MTYRKLALLGGAATVALCVAGPASAFDKVDWEWKLKIHEHINKIVNIKVKFDPTGIANVELAQIHAGDAISNSTMYDVYNDPYVKREDREFDVTTYGRTYGWLGVDGDTHGSLDVDGHTHGQLDVHTDGRGKKGRGRGGSGHTHGSLDVDGHTHGSLDVDGKTWGYLDVVTHGTVVVPTVVAFDALKELPEIENLATSVGNNASIESNRMTEIHAGQFQFGDGDVDGKYDAISAGITGLLYGHLEHAGTNTHQSAAVALTAATILDVIDPSKIEAKAEMYRVTNGQMTNSATALANNLSVDVDATSKGDGILLGDVTQFAYADVKSEAYMNNVSVNNYKNLGKLKGPLFSNSATSIGNNLSITVNGPDKK